MMQGLVSRHANTTDSDRAALAAALPSRNGDLRLFMPYAEALGVPSSASEPANIFYCNASGVLDVLAIGPSMVLFTEAWARGFLRHCCRLLKPGGTLLVPVRDERQAVAEGTWSAQALKELLAPASLEVRGRCALLHAPQPTPVMESVMDWFGGAAIPAITASVVSRYVSTSIPGDQAPVASLAYGSAAAAEGDIHHLARYLSSHLDEEVRRVVRGQSYYLHGIAYKAALLKHIVRTHLPGRDNLAMIDFGGGYGLLMAEMVLDPALRVAKAVVQDLQVQNEIMALHMLNQAGERLRGRFFFERGRAEAFVFTERFDVISFVGSLLYIPREQRAPMLQRCWEALSPGGLLVIHENIKAPSYTRDYEVMFEVEEIDGLMEQFAPVQRYLSNAMKAVTKAQAGAKTVFRVVQKNPA